MTKFFLFISLLLFANCQKTGDEQSTFIRASEDIRGKIAFTHANVISMVNEQVLADQTVYVDNGIIVNIEPTTSFPQNQDFIIDATSMYLLPGLTDSHTHIYYEEDLPLYISNGITSVLNMGSPSSILSFRDRIKKQELIGPTIYASAFVDGAGDRGWVERSPEEVPADIEQIKSVGWDFVKVYNSLKTDVFQKVVDESKVRSLAVIGHGVRQPGMEYILTHGQVMIAHMEEYLYTYFQNQLDESMIPAAAMLTKQTGAFVTPNLSAYEKIVLQLGNGPLYMQWMKQAEMAYVSSKWKDQWNASNTFLTDSRDLHPQFEFLKKVTLQFHQAGIPLLVGTDSPYIPGLLPGYSIHDDLRILTECGLTNYEAIASATSNPGIFMKKFTSEPLSFGTIEVGNRADLLLLKNNPLSDINNLKKQVGVMAQGRWLSDRKLYELLEEIAN
jgi:hypothetical protein